MLFLVNIINDKEPSNIEINNIGLGDIVNKLYEFDVINKLLIPPPWDLKLNEKEIILLQPELWKLFM